MKKILLQNLLSVRNYFLLVAILTGSLSCSTKKDSRVILNRDYKKEIIEGREALRTYFISSSAPGISVSVSVAGKTVWSEGLGYASKELLSPATPRTKYRIGGTSRMLTAFLIARLQQEGKLQINDSFYKYIPTYPKKQWDFTIYQLGIHAAGFPESNTNELFKQSKEYNTLKDYVRGLSEDSLLYQPDTYYTVSDYGPSLLGILAEEITQKKFSPLVRELVLDTLGMDETLVDNPTYLIENRSQPYYMNYIAQLMNAPAIDLGFCAPAIGFLSTADDLNKAGQAVLDSTFFNQEIRNLFFDRHKLAAGYETNLGFGWWIFKDDQGRDFYVQIGSTIGGSSMLLVYPDTKLVVSICSNLSDDLNQLPGEQLAKSFLKKLDPGKEDLKQNGNPAEQGKNSNQDENPS